MLKSREKTAPTQRFQFEASSLSEKGTGLYTHCDGCPQIARVRTSPRSVDLQWSWLRSPEFVNWILTTTGVTRVRRTVAYATGPRPDNERVAPRAALLVFASAIKMQWSGRSSRVCHVTCGDFMTDERWPAGGGLRGIPGMVPNGLLGMWASQG